MKNPDHKTPEDTSVKPQSDGGLPENKPNDVATFLVSDQPTVDQTESIGSPPLLRGNVDRMDKFILVGWAVADGDAVKSLQIRVGNEVIESNTVRLHRQDAADVCGITNPNVGFEMELPASVWKRLAVSGYSFELLGDGIPVTPEPITLNTATATGWVADIIRMNECPEKQYFLHLALEHVRHGNLLPLLNLSDAHFMRQHATAVHYEIEAVNDVGSNLTKEEKSAVKSSQKKGYFERADNFTLVGWAINEDDKPTNLQILINGVIVECNITRQPRQDVMDALGISDPNLGFSIELPGYIWEGIPDDEVKIEILRNGETFTTEPLSLTRATVLKWIASIINMEDSQEKQYLTLVTLEHLRYGDFLPKLLEKDVDFIRDFTVRMKLEDFILASDTNSNDSKSPRDANTIESMTTLLLWRALRTLNERISDSSPSIFDLVKKTIQELRLQGEVRERFLFSVIPILCSTGEFLKMRELIEFSHMQRLGNVDNLWEMTLSIPALICDGQVSRATDVIYGAAKKLDSGWLNTECIRFSVQHLQAMEADGKVESTAAEKFRYAVIFFLDVFRGEWFSRLHDQCLIDSMLQMLMDINRYTDYHRRDVVIAAQRIYGLNPAFWDRAESQKLYSLDSELARSHTHFKKLHRALLGPRTSITDWLEELAEPLAYYRAKNNPEAMIMLREVCATIMPKVNSSLPTRAKALLAKLLATDPSEALRIAAFPLPTENNLLDVFPETTPEILRETLRNLSDQDKSVVWHLQENASAALFNLLSIETSDHGKIEHASDLLEQRAIPLANIQGGFLTFDLLASAYAVAFAHNLECSSLLTRLLWTLQRAIDETKSDWFLPAPVLSGLARLNDECGKSNPLLKSFLADCRSQIRAKFGERMDDLFDLPTNKQLSLKARGWPQDTLVVIYSCRKYLETRVSSIRETWIKDLKARGIPYLVLVGDGDDSITGDVLALDVSDKYEDLPKKSLKLFDWVYNNTDAQYVLKIDDDCYLDVARFFDTLSYRKHFYYGRVLRRSIGTMDRAWHQPKSHTDHGRKTIDKSPEPSIYADGGGGYTLSRLAMQQLLNTEKTPQGARLKASSFMEDKLIGDLLAMNLITPSNEDYDSYQRRRTFGEAMPVGMWENTFYPCLSTPTKMVHLDNHLDLAPTRAKSGSKELWPKKLWPTCWSPDIKLNKNQLELVTDTSAATVLLEHGLMVICVVRNEMILLPHFLSHYRALGVKCFVFVDNCSDDGTREYLFGQPDVILYSADTEYKYSHYGVAWQQAVLGNLCMGKWVLLADADELLVFKDSDTQSLASYIAEIETDDCDAACTIMVDMYPAGDLSEADFSQHSPFDVASWFDKPVVTPWRLGSGWFSNSSSYSSHLRHRIVPNAVPHDFVSQKYALFRYNPWVRLSQGVHYASNLKVSGRASWFAHFKYHAGFKEKIEAEIRRGQHYNNAAEYRRYAAMLLEGKGGFFKEGLSERFNGETTDFNVNPSI